MRKTLLILVTLFFVTSNAHSTIIDIGYLGLSSIAFDQNDNLWVGGSGRYDLNVDTGLEINIYTVGTRGITFDSDNTMYLLGNNSYRSIDSVNGIFFDGDDITNDSVWPFGSYIGAGSSEPVAGDFDINGNLVVGDAGIPSEYFIYDVETSNFSSFLSPFTENTNGHYPYGLAVNPINGDIYVSTLDEVEIYNGLTYEYLRAFDPRISNEIVTGLAFDSLGQLWIADAELIYTYDELFSDNNNSDNNNNPAPVPEPSTMLLLGSGLTGLAWYRRRKKE